MRAKTISNLRFVEKYFSLTSQITMRVPVITSWPPSMSYDIFSQKALNQLISNDFLRKVRVYDVFVGIQKMTATHNIV